MAISKQQPMRPGLVDAIDALNAAAPAIEQLGEDLAAETARAEAAEQANAEAIRIETARARAAERANAEAIALFDYGITESLEIAAQTSSVIQIEFDEEKANVPTVLVTLENDEVTNPVNAYGIATNVYTTGFNVRVHNMDVNSTNITINWLAIGA